MLAIEACKNDVTGLWFKTTHDPFRPISQLPPVDVLTVPSLSTLPNLAKQKRLVQETLKAPGSLDLLLKELLMIIRLMRDKRHMVLPFPCAEITGLKVDSLVIRFREPDHPKRAPLKSHRTLLRGPSKLGIHEQEFPTSIVLTNRELEPTIPGNSLPTGVTL
jgi:hypothetical protein